MTADALNLIVLMLGMLCFAGTIIYVLWKCFDPKDPMMNSHISAIAHVSPFFTERLLYYKKDGVMRSIFDDEGNKTRKKVRFFLDNPNDFSPDDQEDPDAEADAPAEEAGTGRVPPPENAPLDTCVEIDETDNKARGIDKIAEVEIKEEKNGEKDARDVNETPLRTYDDKKPGDAMHKGRCPLILRLFKHLERKGKKYEPSDSEQSEYGTSVPYRHEPKGVTVEPKPKVMDDIPELELYKNDTNNTYLYPPRLSKPTCVEMRPRAYKDEKQEDEKSEWVKIEMKPNRNKDWLKYGRARGDLSQCAQISGYAIRTPLSMVERRVPGSSETKQETDAETKIEFENEEERKVLEKWESKLRQESQAPERIGVPKFAPQLRCLPDKKQTPKSESLASTERIEVIDEKRYVRKFGGKTAREKEKATPETRSSTSQSKSPKSSPRYHARLSPAAKSEDKSKSPSRSPVQKSGLRSDEVKKHLISETCVLRRKEGGKSQEHRTPHIVVIDEVHSVVSKSQRKRARQRGVIRRTPLPDTPSKSPKKEPQVVKLDERYSVVKKCPSQIPKQQPEVPRSGKKRSPMSGSYLSTIELSPSKLLAERDYASKHAQVKKGAKSEEPKQSPAEQRKQWEPEFHKMGGRKPYMPIPEKGTPMKHVESEKSLERSESRSKVAMSGLKKLRLINKKAPRSEEKPKKSVPLPMRSNSDSPVLAKSQKSSSAVDKTEYKKSPRVWNIPILTKWENPLHRFQRMFMAKEIPIVVEKQGHPQKPKTPVTSIKVEYMEETMKPAQKEDSLSHEKRVISKKMLHMNESSVESKERMKEKPVSESTKSRTGVAEKKSCVIDEQQSVRAYEMKAAKAEIRSQMETSKERLMDKRSHYSRAAGEIDARTPGMTGENFAAFKSTKIHANMDLKTPVESDDFSIVASIKLGEGKKKETEELKPWDLIKKLSDEQNARLAHWKEDNNELEIETRSRTAAEDARLFVRKYEAGKRLKLVKKLDAGMDASAMGDRLVTQKYQHPESMKITDGRSPAFLEPTDSNQNLKQQGGTRQFECKIGNISINMSQSEHVSRKFVESEGFAKSGHPNEATTKNLMHESSNAVYRGGISHTNAPKADESAETPNAIGQVNQSDEEKPKKIDPWYISKDVYELENKEMRRQSPARSGRKTPEKKSETLTDGDSSTEGSQSGSPTVAKQFGSNDLPKSGSDGDPNKADKMKKRDRPPRKL